MRHAIIVLSMLLGVMTSAAAQLSIGIGLPGVSIGVNVPLYPELVRVPGYPVYYAPGLASNYFFYDGMYWIYQGDNWYASSWYNGPWGMVMPEVVPLYVLRVPVRYYRNPPMYFRGWRGDVAPRWGDYWGPAWQRQRPGWDQWNRNAMPAPAPLPAYQRQYSADRYPHPDQQQVLRTQNYRYQSRDADVRQHAQEPARQPVPMQRGPAGQEPRKQPQPVPRELPAPATGQPAPPPNAAGPQPQDQHRPPQPDAGQREQTQPAPKQKEPAQDKASPHDQAPRQGQGKDREGGPESVQDHKK